MDDTKQPPQPPRGWVKFVTAETLTGSWRDRLTPADRGIYLDLALLADAGGGTVPYTLRRLCGVLDIEAGVLRGALAHLVEAGYVIWSDGERPVIVDFEGRCHRTTYVRRQRHQPRGNVQWGVDCAEDFDFPDPPAGVGGAE